MDKNLNDFADEVHRANRKWWCDINAPCKGECDGGETSMGNACAICGGTGFQRKERNIGELLMLTVSELAEAMEGHRKYLPDDKLPHRSMFEVELADTLIRIFDMAGGLNLDLHGAYLEKMEYNRNRADHQIENRKQVGGKAY